VGTGATDLDPIGRPRDRQPAVVVGLVAGAACQDEVRSVMASAVGAMDQMMELQAA
jgi:hypothetical protein